MPFLAGSFLGLAGVILFLGNLWEEKKDGEGAPKIGLSIFWEKGLWVIVASFFYCVFLDALGYILSTILLLSLLMRILGRRSWLRPIFTSFLVSSVTYFIFHVWLRINLPRGLFEIG